MINNHILLIHGDRLLTKLYREKLEGSGFIVAAASHLEQAQKLMASRMPAVILLDLVQDGDPIQFISSIRGQEATASIPVLILPTAVQGFDNIAVQEGATKVIVSSESPIASVINAVKVNLGLGELGDAASLALFKPDEFWIKAVLSNAQAAINQMRNRLPGISSTPPEIPALRQLWMLVHGFAEQVALLPHKPLARFATALDLLLHDLNDAPEQLNYSTLRTIAQSLDFLAMISKPECLDRLVDPSSARILAVDDEPSVLMCISSALQLAEIACEHAQGSADCLAKLRQGHHDLIFLDIGLPQVDGFALCTKIRNLPTHKTTPIVFITGMATFHNKSTACLSGGNDFVGKPFNLPELGVKALTWLYRGQLESAPEGRQLACAAAH